ncbi:hypothetical protein CSB20_12900, partial [bacterium DOLZORAL124_64_63]
ERLGTIRDGQVVVDRQKVIAAALAHNEMLAASGAMKDAAAADALGAWRGFLPQLQLGEYFMRSDDALSSFGFKLQNRGVTPLDFGMGLGPSGIQWIPANINDPGETNNFITRIQLLQPIFNGGMGFYGKQAANAAHEAAGYKHARATETIRFHAIQAYEGLTLATAYTRVMEAAVRSAEGHVRQARSLVENEMATEADLLQARVYLSTLQQKLIEVKNMVRVAGENIKLLTAIDTPLPLASDFDEAAAALSIPVEMPAFFDVTAVTRRSDILARRHEAEAAGKMVGVARGGMLPHLNLSLQKDWYDLDSPFGTNADSWTLGVYATMGFGVQNLGELKKAKAQSRAARYMADFETRQARVQATDAWLGKQAANAAHEAAGYKHARATETIRFHAIQAYEGLTLATAYTRVMEAAVRSAEGHVRQARSLVENEMATEADLLQARVYLSTLQQKLIEVKNMVRVAGENIKLLTAIDTPLPLASDFDEAAAALSIPVEMPAFFDVTAVTRRSDILARRHEAEAAGKMVGVARGGMLPHLNLSLQKDWYDLDSPFGTNADSWTLGVYATMGFGVQNLGELKKAKAQSRAARYMADFETRQARVQATDAWLNLQAAHEKVLVAREAVQAARAGLKIVTNQYREGLAGMVDLLDTQAYATQAEGNLVQALHDFRVGLADLEFNGAPIVAVTTQADNPTQPGQ